MKCVITSVCVIGVLGSGNESVHLNRQVCSSIKDQQMYRYTYLCLRRVDVFKQECNDRKKSKGLDDTKPYVGTKDNYKDLNYMYTPSRRTLRVSGKIKRKSFSLNIY